MQTRAEESSGKFALDHRYAVHKQRFTIGRPEGQRKTLIDLWETGLLMRWTEDSLAAKGDKAFSYMQMPAIQFLHIIPALPAGWTRKYSRLENLPVLVMQYDGKEGQLEIRALSGEDADLIKLTLTSKPGNKVAVTIDTKGGISANKQEYDEKGGSTRFEDGTLWRNDARIHLLAIGGNVVPVSQDAATLRIEMTADRISQTVWLIAPHRAGKPDLPTLRQRDWDLVWQKEMKAWKDVLAAHKTRFQIPDKALQAAYESCLADLFLMRELISKKEVVVLAGTDPYRCVNVFETMVHVQALLRAGYADKAWQVAEPYLRFQKEDGRWDDYSPWCTRAWVGLGAISLMYRDYYGFTQDREHGLKTYRQLVKLARWIHAERQKSKTLNTDNPLYGLMPAGLGDCGLERDLGHGKEHVYYPHNSYTVAGLKAILDFSRDLGTPEEQKELSSMYEDARDCLIRSMEKTAAIVDGKPIVPVTPGHNGGSRWGSLVMAYPGQFIPLNHPLVEGGLLGFEKNLAESGLPLGGGWQAKGVWPGQCLEDWVPVYLRRGETDKLTAMIYLVLNHASPVWTWPEERAPEADTLTTSGDLQEAWAPTHFCWKFRDCLLYEEEKTLHLAAGVPRHWYELDQPIEVINAPSYFGLVSFKLACDRKKNTFLLEGTIEKPAQAGLVVAHLNLPENWIIAGLSGKNINAKVDQHSFSFAPSDKFSFSGKLQRR